MKKYYRVITAFLSLIFVSMSTNIASALARSNVNEKLYFDIKYFKSSLIFFMIAMTLVLVFTFIIFKFLGSVMFSSSNNNKYTAGIIFLSIFFLGISYFSFGKCLAVVNHLDRAQDYVVKTPSESLGHGLIFIEDAGRIKINQY